MESLTSTGVESATHDPGGAPEVELLDGPMGTELERLGYPTRLPLWSALANEEAAELVREVHRAYAAAGATIHTANTFRTQPRLLGSRFKRLTKRAVALAFEALDQDHQDHQSSQSSREATQERLGKRARVAGSLAPIEDCYRPDLSPGRGALKEHREMASALAAAGVDLILCETFPHIEEGLAALEAALETELPVYLSFSPGPSDDLLSPDEIARGAERAFALGASAVLVNCLSARGARPYIEALSSAGGRFGVYANAGIVEHEVGFSPDRSFTPEEYADLAEEFRALGASIFGACCGMGPAHIGALAERLLKQPQLLR